MAYIMKIVYIAILVLLLAMPIVRLLSPEMAVYGFGILVASGLLFDLTDFVIRAFAVFRRKKVPSASMFFGLLLVIVGLFGLIVLPRSGATSELKSWLLFLGLAVTAIIFHVFIHIVLPLLFTMACNIFYGRKLLDMRTLPPIRNKK